MKKLIFILLVLLTVNATAQENDQPLQRGRVTTNGLLDNWFVQAGVQWNENGTWKPFQGKLALGKWWAPTIGTRLALTGVKGNTIVPYMSYITEGGCYEVYGRDDFTQFTLSGDVLFNLSNMVMGYNEERLWNLIPFCGPAIARNCSSNEYVLGLQLGLLNTLRLSHRLAANIEVGWQRLEPSFTGCTATSGWGSHARRFYAEVGLTLNIGKHTGWQKAPDVEAIHHSYEAEIEALNAQLEDANAEIERLTNGDSAEPEEPAE